MKMPEYPPQNVSPGSLPIVAPAARASPTPPGLDLEDWAQRPYRGRLRLMCDAWAMQGFGAPGIGYLFYLVKLVLYVAGFLAFAVTTRGIGGLGAIGDWWSEPIVFQKAVL